VEQPADRQRFNVVSPTGLLALGFVVGLVARLSGLSFGSGLFRDDAWVAAPSQTSFAHAAGLVSTFPGFSLGLWPWLHVTAPSVLAAQVPAFVAGLCTLPALWWMLRRFAVAPWIAAVVAVAISLSPVVITYSTRVKPYTTELVLAALLLGLSTARSTRYGWWLLGLASVTSFTVSFATAPVIAACWISVALTERSSPRFARSVVAPAASVGGLSLLVIYLTWHPVPPSLRAFWQPFYVDFSSVSSLARSAQRLFGGLSSGLTGAPLLTTTRPLTTLAALSVLVALGALVGLGIATGRLRAIAPTAALGLALVLAALHLVPLGGGRTDEVLYPALSVLVAFGLTRLLDLRPRLLHQLVSFGIAIATLLVIAMGATVHRAQYPASDLDKALAASTTQPFAASVLTVIDAPLRYNFAWSGFAAISPQASVSLVATSTNEAGYTVRLSERQPQLFIANADHGDSTYHPDAWVRKINARVSPGQTLTFFSLTEQVVNPTTGHLPGQALDPHRSPFWKAFLAAGWKPGAFGVVRGVYYQILVAGTPRH